MVLRYISFLREALNLICNTAFYVVMNDRFWRIKKENDFLLQEIRALIRRAVFGSAGY